MKPNPLSKEELGLLLSYIEGNLTRKALMKAIGSNNPTGANWKVGAWAVRGIKSGQFQQVKK